MPGDADTAAVVVADDDEALRLLCRINLELEGFRVLEAKSAEELAEILAGEEVALILLDVRFGAADGIEIARELRVSRPEIPIAFFTGSTELQEVRRHADDVLAKPFALEQLSELANRLARREIGRGS